MIGNGAGKTALMNRAETTIAKAIRNIDAPEGSVDLTFSTSNGPVTLVCHHYNSIFTNIKHPKYHGAMVIFAAEATGNFNEVKDHCKAIRDHHGDIPIVICGNKADLVAGVALDYDTSDLKSIPNATFHWTSAIVGYNFDAPWSDLMRRLVSPTLRLVDDVNATSELVCHQKTSCVIKELTLTGITMIKLHTTPYDSKITAILNRIDPCYSSFMRWVPRGDQVTYAGLLKMNGKLTKPFSGQYPSAFHVSIAPYAGVDLEMLLHRDASQPCDGLCGGYRPWTGPGLRMSATYAKEMIRTITYYLMRLHKVEIIHNNLRTDNILINATEEEYKTGILKSSLPKITGFGKSGTTILRSGLIDLQDLLSSCLHGVVTLKDNKEQHWLVQATIDSDKKEVENYINACLKASSLGTIMDIDR